jgi:hypothetical protein
MNFYVYPCDKEKHRRLNNPAANRPSCVTTDGRWLLS